jgi:hypothetical protein
LRSQNKRDFGPSQNRPDNAPLKWELIIYPRRLTCHQTTKSQSLAINEVRSDCVAWPRIASSCSKNNTFPSNEDEHSIVLSFIDITVPKKYKSVRPDVRIRSELLKIAVRGRIDTMKLYFSSFRWFEITDGPIRGARSNKEQL